MRFLLWKFFQRKGVTVLMYHDIDAQSFNRHIEYLRARYSIISMDEFLKYCEGEIKVPEYSVVITFDDGHKRNYDLLPVLKDLSVPVTIFLCSGIINTNRRYWFLNGLKDVEIQRLKGLTNDKRLEELANFGFSETKEYDERQALNLTEIEEMKQYVNFQSHTIFHSILPKCEDNISEKEIKSSKEILSQELGFEIDSFAYPNGDYGPREIKYLKASGYKNAFTTKHGYNTPKTNSYEFYRIDSNDTSDINEFAIRSCGLWEYLKDPISIIDLFRFNSN